MQPVAKYQYLTTASCDSFGVETVLQYKGTQVSRQAGVHYDGDKTNKARF